MFFSACSAASALLSWMTPSSALSSTIATITIGSTQSPLSPCAIWYTFSPMDTSAAISRMMTIALFIWSKNRWKKFFGFFSRRRFGPCSRSRSSAACAVSPVDLSVCNSCNTASCGSLCQII